MIALVAILLAAIAGDKEAATGGTETSGSTATETSATTVTETSATTATETSATTPTETSATIPTDTVAPAIRGIRLSPQTVRTLAVIGSSSKTGVEVSNIGDVPVVLEDPVIDPDGSPFTASGCSGATLAPAGPPCPVTVVFQPRESGQASARLIIRGAGGIEETVPVTGFALEPVVGKLISDPESPIVMTNDPPSRTVTVRNVGTGPVTLGQGSADSVWLALQKDGCSNTSLAPQQMCTFVLSMQSQRRLTAVVPVPRRMKARLSFDVQGTASSPFVIDVVTP